MNDGTRRLFLILSLLVAGGGLAFVAFGDIGENLVYYWNQLRLSSMVMRLMVLTSVWAVL